MQHLCDSHTKCSLSFSPDTILRVMFFRPHVGLWSFQPLGTPWATTIQSSVCWAVDIPRPFLSCALKIVKSISACTLCVRQKRLFRPVSLDFILRAPSFSLAGAAQLPILIEWRRALSAARYSLKAARMWCGHYFLCDSLSHFLDCVWVREFVFCRLACSIHFGADRQLELGPTAIKCGANEIAISANFSNCAHLLFEKRSLWGSPCDSDCEISVFYVVNFNFSCLTWEQLNNLWKRHSWMTLQQLNKKINQSDTLRYQKNTEYLVLKHKTCVIWELHPFLESWSKIFKIKLVCRDKIVYWPFKNANINFYAGEKTSVQKLIFVHTF